MTARGFVSTQEDVAAWADGSGRRRLLMEDFHRDARRRHGVLLDGAEPVGGRWASTRRTGSPRRPTAAPRLNRLALFGPHEGAMLSGDRWLARSLLPPAHNLGLLDPLGGACIDRMSACCGGCRYDPRRRLGDDACPCTAGYWAFLERVRPLPAGNRRMRRPLQGLDRLEDLPLVVEQEQRRGPTPP